MSHSRSFAELLTEYMARTGIGDAELARRINVNRLTLIRWREGVTERPRHREDVARCADVLRLTPDERNELLLAAGFQPDSPAVVVPTTDESADTSDGEALGREETAVPPIRESNVTRKWILAIAATLAAVVLLGAGLAVVTGSLDLVGPDPTPEPATPVPTPIATSSPGATSTPTPVIPTATPRPATIARDGESLILVAPFANYTAGGQGYNVSGRLRERIDAELNFSGLPNARTFLWPETIRSEVEARDATLRSGALLTIWGEYDSGRVLARFTTAQSSDGTGEQRIVDIASSPSELPTTINVNLTGAVRYLTLVTTGRVYLDQGEYDRAKAVLVRASNPPPGDPSALADIRLLLGMAYLGGESFDFDESIVMFSFVLDEDPRSVEALNGRAVAYMRRGRDGDIDRALPDLIRAESIRPDHGETYSNLGAAYMIRAGRNDPDRAITAFGQAVNLALESEIAYVNRAGAYIARGLTSDLELARSDVNRALERDPNLANAYVTSGLLRVASGGRVELNLSIVDYGRAIELAPESPIAWFHRGLAYSELGSLSQSAADLEKAAELAPSILQYQDAACRALTVGGDAASALRYCDVAVQAGYEKALLSRSLAYAMLNLPEEAERDLAAYIAWARSLWGQACRAALLDAASLLDAPIATSRGEAEMWDLLAFRPLPIIPGRPTC